MASVKYWSIGLETIPAGYFSNCVNSPEVEFFSVDAKLDDLKQEQDRLLLSSTLEEEFQQVKYLYKTVKSNAVINEIKKEINIYNADILVMVPQKYGFWDSLVHKSKTRIMAAGLDIPLLSFPNF